MLENLLIGLNCTMVTQKNKIIGIVGLGYVGLPLALEFGKIFKTIGYDISSDKAVRPTNIMGATKRIAELICQSLYNSQKNTKFSIVRFGNVIGSSGSVIPLFENQIKDGGPLTITHKKIERYFMTINEAVGLVIQSSAMSEGKDIFVLDMGKPVKIIDLAFRMVKLMGGVMM